MGSRVHRGSCLCGKVSHSVSGSPILSAYCHCTLCQSLNSAAFIHTLHFPSSVFKWTHSEPHEALLESFSVPSRPWKTRWRCKNCGCTVASYNSKADKWSVWGHQLEKDSDGKTKGWAVLQPTAHIFYETRAQDVGDSLGKWTGYEGLSDRIG